MTVGHLHLEQRARVALIGTLALLVALVATAFAVGGSGSPHNETSGGLAVATGVGAPHGTTQFSADRPASAGALAAPSGVPLAASALVPQAGSGSVTAASSGSGSGSTDATDDGDSITATKIVKTGQLTIRVDDSQVKSKVGDLSALATDEGGYVSSSNTDTGGGEQSGEVVLRVPVSKFSDAVTKAAALGHELSLTTSADDVTGRYVDLAARKQALEQTRSTYLTILGRARTIGATLEVQDRIQDVQSQIDQLTGQLKLLGNQASYSTLTVDVTTAGIVAAADHHQRHGLSKAWHTSWSRFARGFDAIVGAIGPIVLALLILAVIAGVLTVGYRGVRRATS